MRRLFTILCAGLIGHLGVATAAPMLLGTTGTGGTPSTLVELDPTTGALVRTIGAVGYAVNGMTWDATTGTLYAGTSIRDASFNGLITIDLTTGAGTPIGAANWGDSFGSIAVTNVAADAAGNLVGWWDPGEDDLVSINKATGVATRVGESGVGTAINGLSFDNADTLYMVNVGGGTYTVDRVTGAATFVGDLQTTAHHGDFHPLTNLYYGINATSGARSLIVADLTTFTLSSLPTVDDLHVLEFIGDRVTTVVPEPGSMALLGLGCLGLLRRRRR